MLLESSGLLEDRKVVVNCFRAGPIEFRDGIRGKPVSVFVKKLLRLLALTRLGEQKSLAVIAAQVLQDSQLAGSFDTLGDDTHAKIFRERNYRLKHSRVLAVLTHTVYERPVD